MRDFRQLRNLYQNIKPDPFIQSYDEEYNWYETLYDSVRTHRREIQDEVEDGMIDIVRSNVSVSEKEDHQEKRELLMVSKIILVPSQLQKRKKLWRRFFD